MQSLKANFSRKKKNSYKQYDKNHKSMNDTIARREFSRNSGRILGPELKFPEGEKVAFVEIDTLCARGCICAKKALESAKRTIIKILITIPFHMYNTK